MKIPLLEVQINFELGIFLLMQVKCVTTNQREKFFALLEAVHH